MIFCKYNPAILFFLLFIGAFPASLLEAADPAAQVHKRSLGVGFAFMGPLIRKGLPKDFSLEFHYLFGHAGTSDEDISAKVFGLRGYRHFFTDRQIQPYVGVEGAYLTASNSSRHTSGYSAGGFAGIEYYLASRFSLGFDIGPYYTWLREKEYQTSNGGFDFVLSTYFTVYIF